MTETYSSALGVVLPTVAFESPDQYDSHPPALVDPEAFLHDLQQSFPAPDSAFLSPAQTAFLLVFSASDILWRCVKADITYRSGRQGNERDYEVPHRDSGPQAGRRGGERDDGVASGTIGWRAGRWGGERDDGVASGTTGWRAGRRGRDSNRGGEAVSRGARAADGTAELHFGRLKWREATESYRNLIEIDFGKTPLLSKYLPNFGRRFRYRLVPYRNLWNIMLPWNRVVTSSLSIFQTSREHVLVALTVSTFCACHVLSSDRSDRLASPSENKN
jgi:hypothetical protein